jgi:NAD(P)H-hydrate epimerase
MIVEAHLTLSLQFPKLAFLFVENSICVGEWKVLDIGLHPQAIEDTPSETYFLEEKDIKLLIKNRSKFGHKGTFGHAFIVAGSRGMAGASILSAKAALRSGAGLVTVHSCSANRNIVQTALPEAIFSTDESEDYITNVFESNLFDHIALGPGIGMMPDTEFMLESILKTLEKSCVLDADALNIISRKKELLQLIPQKSILTPHPKEFERMFGKCDSTYQRMKKALEAAHKMSVIIILKGAYTLIAMPDGTCFFNSTGNSGMATAGSGDVLTGILVSLMAQGYSSEDTAKIGVFLHGRAGNLALELQSEESLIASDIISQLGNEFKSIKNV